MLAYLFWHSPRAEGAEAYEPALERFHSSLAARPPVGYLGSACYRAGSIPWLDGAIGYEDWYFLEDYASLGVLNEAALARGHRTAHERAAGALGRGAAGLYRHCEGDVQPADVRLSVWVTPARLTEQTTVAGLLMADGAKRQDASLWRRQLVLGPAPEYCLLCRAEPAGVRSSRLPAGWSAATSPRQPLWSSR